MAVAITQKQLRAELEPITKEVIVVKKILTGNGDTIGLDELVRTNTGNIERNRKDIDKLLSFVEQLHPIILFYRVGVWFAGALGLSVLALLWSLITGQISINFSP